MNIKYALMYTTYTTWCIYLTNTCLDVFILILEKIERIKKRTQRRNEILEFNEARAKLLPQINDTTIQFDTTMEIKTRPNVKDDTAEEIDAKVLI